MEYKEKIKKIFSNKFELAKTKRQSVFIFLFLSFLFKQIFYGKKEEEEKKHH
jgi:hypothetical protein